MSYVQRSQIDVEEKHLGLETDFSLEQRLIIQLLMSVCVCLFLSQKTVQNYRISKVKYKSRTKEYLLYSFNRSLSMKGINILVHQTLKT